MDSRRRDGKIKKKIKIKCGLIVQSVSDVDVTRVKNLEQIEHLYFTTVTERVHLKSLHPVPPWQTVLVTETMRGCKFRLPG